MYIPIHGRFQMRSRVKHAEKVAKLAMGTGAELLRFKPNYDDLKKSTATGTNDPFLRERFIQMVLGIIGDR